MVDAWPSSLPQNVLSEGYTEERPTVSIRSQMDTGPAKVRRRFTVGIPDFNLPQVMTLAQTETLDLFHDTTLQGGVLPFTWLQPRTQDPVTLRFVEPPKYVSIGAGFYQVSLRVEELPA